MQSRIDTIEHSVLRVGIPCTASTPYSTNTLYFTNTLCITSTPHLSVSQPHPGRLCRICQYGHHEAKANLLMLLGVINSLVECVMSFLLCLAMGQSHQVVVALVIFLHRTRYCYKGYMLYVTQDTCYMLHRIHVICYMACMQHVTQHTCNMLHGMYATCYIACMQHVTQHVCNMLHSIHATCYMACMQHVTAYMQHVTWHVCNMLHSIHVTCYIAYM